MMLCVHLILSSSEATAGQFESDHSKSRHVVQLTDANNGVVVQQLAVQCLSSIPNTTGLALGLSRARA